MWRILGYPSAEQADKTPPSGALPASWYRSNAMYELERRAMSVISIHVMFIDFTYIKLIGS
jgi:hypothetical protein